MNNIIKVIIVICMGSLVAACNLREVFVEPEVTFNVSTVETGVDFSEPDQEYDYRYSSGYRYGKNHHHSKPSKEKHGSRRGKKSHDPHKLSNHRKNKTTPGRKSPEKNREPERRITILPRRDENSSRRLNSDRNKNSSSEKREQNRSFATARHSSSTDNQVRETRHTVSILNQRLSSDDSRESVSYSSENSSNDDSETGQEDSKTGSSHSSSSGKSSSSSNNSLQSFINLRKK